MTRVRNFWGQYPLSEGRDANNSATTVVRLDLPGHYGRVMRTWPRGRWMYVIVRGGEEGWQTAHFSTFPYWYRESDALRQCRARLERMARRRGDEV